MKTHRILLIATCALVAGLSLPAHAIQTADSKTASTANNSESDWRTKLSQSPSGVEDVAKLAKSGVDESVVLSFVQNSTVPYRLSADEIIKLRDQGISAKVITTMLQRGAELREQSAQALKESATRYAQSAPAQPATTYSYPATTTYVAPASTIVYFPSYPSYSYSYYVPAYGYSGCYYPRSYYYPSYYSCYPRASYYGGYCGGYYPRYSFGVSFGGVHHGGFSGGFHGGYRGGGFHHRH
jgi:hypothetical protein